MKLITLPRSAFKDLPPMTRAEWMAFFRAHGIDPDKVVQINHEQSDLEKTVYEVED